jgi:hypothetical protein
MAFPYLSFAYRAFIPQSVGRSMSEIFRHHPNFNRQDLVNYDQFAAFLHAMDIRGRSVGTGGNWIAEPPPFNTLLHTFAMTNDGEFEAGSGFRRHTTGKVSIEGVIDLREIGHISTFSPPIKVPPRVHAYQCQAGIVPQTSSLNVGYPGIQTTTGRYVGVFKNIEAKDSFITGRVSAMNKSSGIYISPPGTPAEELYDTTVLSARAAGSYPFIRLVAPDIDMQLTVTLRRWGDQIEIRFDGQHDQFPAYELLVDNVRQRRWDPVANGQLGPNPINLHTNYLHTQVRTTHTVLQRLPYGYKQPHNRSPFGLPHGF